MELEIKHIIMISIITMATIKIIERIIQISINIIKDKKMIKTNFNRVGEFIYNYCRLNDISIEKLGKQIGYSKTMMYDVCKGKRKLSQNMERKIINYFTLSKEDIIKLKTIIALEYEKILIDVKELNVAEIYDLIESIFHLISDEEE